MIVDEAGSATTTLQFLLVIHHAPTDNGRYLWKINSAALALLIDSLLFGHRHILHVDVLAGLSVGVLTTTSSCSDPNHLLIVLAAAAAPSTALLDLHLLILRSCRTDGRSSSSLHFLFLSQGSL